MIFPINVDMQVAESNVQVDMQVAESNVQYDLETATQIIVGNMQIYYDTTENWNSKPSLRSKKGCIYIYNDKGTINDGGEEKLVPGIKAGDGTSYLIDMPFMGADLAADLYSHIQDFTSHVTSSDRMFWNNKSSAFLNPSDTDTLVLSNTHFMLNGEILNG